LPGLTVFCISATDANATPSDDDAVS